MRIFFETITRMVGEVIMLIFRFLKKLFSNPVNTVRWAFILLVPSSVIYIFGTFVIKQKIYKLYDAMNFLGFVGLVTLIVSGALFLIALFVHLKKSGNFRSNPKQIAMLSVIAVVAVHGWCLAEKMIMFAFKSAPHIGWGTGSGIMIGRPLRKHGKLTLSSTGQSREWLLNRKFSTPHHDWIENAQGEHSSVSAFADLSLKLADLGCPPDLLKRAHQAAIDEINHAQLAFTLDAARNDNRAPLGPAAKRGLLGDAGHMLRVQKMAIETFTDGCLFEARSAQGLRKMVDEEPDEAIRQEIQRTVIEEDRHVELAWKILEWCFRETAQPTLRARLYGQLVKILDRAEKQDNRGMIDILNNARVSLEKIYATQAA